MSTGRLLLVQLGAERVALAIDAVREVLDAPTLAPVPLAPPALLGQLAWRGEFLPVLDLGALLGIARTATGAGVALVMAEGRVATLVDDVLDFWDGDGVALRPLPSSADGRGLLRAVVHRGRDVAGLVDADALHGVAVATLRTVPDR
jgi:purine-binding chemotaxis protein CheW